MDNKFKAVTRLINNIREKILDDQGVSLADMDKFEASVRELAHPGARLAQEVHFYRRGREKHWYQTSAEHIATIKGLAEESYECRTYYAQPLGGSPIDPETASYDWMAAEQLKGRAISTGMREAYEEALRSTIAPPIPDAERMAQGDAIARSKYILHLVDEYTERPSADTRGALRKALMLQFERSITPHDLLEIARATGLRAHMHGVRPSAAREILAAFVTAVPAAACGAAPGR